MKAKDFGVIAIVVVVSAVISLFLSGILFSTPEDRSQTVEVVESISSDFQRPDATYFNANSINPAQNIQIGIDPNSNPFEGR